MEQKYWKVKALPLKGHKYDQVLFNANIYLKLYRNSGSGRKPHIKSPAFGRRKIFFDYFWKHLFEKPLSQRKRRMKLIPCGLEIMKNSTIQPTAKVVSKNASLSAEKLFRSYGELKDGRTFIVQIKETKKHALQLMSIFFET